jgi:hypothetical protein
LDSLLAGFIAACVIMPVIVYMTVYTLSRQRFKNNKKAVRLSADVTTLFLIMAVHYAVIALFERSYLWIIMIILILLASIVLFMHYKVREEVNLKRVFTGFWRASFLLFSIGYFLLAVIGIAERIIKVFI